MNNGYPLPPFKRRSTTLAVIAVIWLGGSTAITPTAAAADPTWCKPTPRFRPLASFPPPLPYSRVVNEVTMPDGTKFRQEQYFDPLNTKARGAFTVSSYIATIEEGQNEKLEDLEEGLTGDWQSDIWDELKSVLDLDEEKWNNKTNKLLLASTVASINEHMSFIRQGASLTPITSKRPPYGALQAATGLIAASDLADVNVSRNEDGTGLLVRAMPPGGGGGADPQASNLGVVAALVEHLLGLRDFDFPELEAIVNEEISAGNDKGVFDQGAADDIADAAKELCGRLDSVIDFLTDGRY